MKTKTKTKTTSNPVRMHFVRDVVPDTLVRDTYAATPKHSFTCYTVSTPDAAAKVAAAMIKKLVENYRPGRESHIEIHVAEPYAEVCDDIILSRLDDE